MPEQEHQHPRGTLLIVGASARAAAMSARRAGYRPLAIDLFGDRDLTAIAETKLSTDYPHDIPQLARQFPAAPFLFTGAIENYPSVLDKLNRARPELTNPHRTYRTLNDPAAIEQILREASLPALHTTRTDQNADRSVRWLKKPIRSGGGLGIAFWDGKPFDRKKFHLQEYREGTSCSALFLADGAHSSLIGVTRQLVGLPKQNDSPFLYCGNIANWPVPETTRETLARIGNPLIAASRLRGLFGIDFILEDDTPWLVEVNPRYTASVELFEAIHRESYLQRHVDSFSTTGISPIPVSTTECLAANLSVSQRADARGSNRFPATARLAVKVIVYPQRDLLITAELNWESLGSGDFLPAVADLPQIGTRIASGTPLCTLFAEGNSHAELDSILCARWMQLSEQFDTVVTDSLGDFPDLFSA